MYHCTGVQVSDTHWKLYWLPVVIGGVEPQEGGGIVLAWIADPKLYPGSAYARGSAVATGGRFVKMFGFLLI